MFFYTYIAKYFLKICELNRSWIQIAKNNINKKLVTESIYALDKFKYEVANEVGVNLKDGYNGDISSRDAGRIGGNMVKKMIQQVENNMINR